MGTFIQDGATVLPPLKSNASAATGSATEFAADDSNQIREALLDLRTAVNGLSPLVEIPAHNNLTGVQGGSITERYHLTSAELAAISGNADSVTAVNRYLQLTKIAADMSGVVEDHPHGVPDNWGFYSGPVAGRMNNPFNEGVNATAANPWGQVYETVDVNPAANTRVNIRNMQLWFRSLRTGVWTRKCITSQPTCRAYYEDFSQPSIAADVRNEPDGTISVRAGTRATTGVGYNAHFYPSSRVLFDPTDIGAWLSIYEARLILHDPNGTDDRWSAKYIASAGADYWPDLTGYWAAPGAPAMADGKLKYVRPYWRWYAIVTVIEADLVGQPPVLDIVGSQ